MLQSAADRVGTSSIIGPSLSVPGMFNFILLNWQKSVLIQKSRCKH